MKSYLTFFCLGLSLLFVGCNNSDSAPADSQGEKNETAKPSAHAHAHPTHGPHKGDLIELGNEEYHGELVHDQESVTIYILDSAAKKAVPIKAKEIVVNLKHNDKAEQFKLAASPEESETDGNSSRFVSNDKEFAKEIDHSHGEATLVLTIKGKQFRGKIAHNHAGHEH